MNVGQRIFGFLYARTIGLLGGLLDAVKGTHRKALIPPRSSAAARRQTERENFGRYRGGRSLRPSKRPRQARFVASLGRWPRGSQAMHRLGQDAVTKQYTPTEVRRAV